MSRWVFRLSNLADDLALIDGLMREDLAAEATHSVAFFRMLITRLYEGRPIEREMRRRAAVANFLMDEAPTSADAQNLLREAYQRPAPNSPSRVEETYERARHLTVHYFNQPGELARILRSARNVEARVFKDDTNEVLTYLWPQDVMEKSLWPKAQRRQADVEFAHELTQAFTALFTRVMVGYRRRMDVSADDIVWVAPRASTD